VLRLYRYVAPGLIALVLGIRFGTILLVRPAPALDEPIHLKVAQQFGPGLASLEQLRDYPSATGPLFYVLFGNLGALFGYDLTLLRIAVFALSLGSLLLFHRILKRLVPGMNQMPAVALLATAPYFASLAGVFMTEHLALLLGLAALLCYLRFREAGKHLDAALALLFATLSVYTRAYYVFLPAAFFVTDIVQRPAGRNSTPAAHRSPPVTNHSSRITSLLWLLPILVFVPMAMLWRGLSPPAFQSMYHVGFQWKNSSSILVWTGIVFLPWAWDRLRPWHLLALLAVPALLLAPEPGLGVTRTFLNLLPRPVSLVFVCVFGSVGLLWFHRLAGLAGDRVIRVAAIGALLLAAGLLVSGPQVYERYLLPGIPLMLICARPSARPGLALAWAGLFQFPLVFAHIIHLSS
jgi:hypothetical protein